MQLIQEILIHVLETQSLEVRIPALPPGSLDDAECFQRIEEIVCAYEAIGSDGGSRHDF